MEKDRKILLSALKEMKVDIVRTLSREVLISALEDQDDEIRQKAAWVLGARRDLEAVDPLIRALEREKTPLVRAEIAWALAKMWEAVKEKRRALEEIARKLEETAEKLLEQHFA